MPEPAPRRFGRLASRRPRLPSERDWERSVLLQPRPAPRHPELISDGGGLPFPPAALAVAAGPLEPEDPAVAALIGQLAKQSAAPSLDGFRAVARSESEVLFARGRPPQLVTVAVRRDPRRDRWSCVGVSAARPLRAARNGIRASSWRLDPTRAVAPQDRVLHVLVAEQSLAGGRKADGRLLEPDLHLGPRELVLTIFVTPLPGFQTRSANPETPARIALPDAVGPRRLIDGALYAGYPSE